VPTWFERLAAAGVSPRAVLAVQFLDSGLTQAAYRGAEIHPANPTDDYAQLVADAVRAAPGLVYGYTAELDTAAHLFGIGSDQWHTAATNIDALLSRLLEALPADTTVLVTADHGGLNVPPEARIDLDSDPRLAEGIQVVAGEPRVRYLHTAPGAAGDVLAVWGELLDGRAAVYSREQAVATGMFGPVAARHLDRLGDVVVVCSGDAAVLASAHDPPEASRLVGLHGGAGAAEMAIPLIVVRS
jgi:hypothetical protein